MKCYRCSRGFLSILIVIVIAGVNDPLWAQTRSPWYLRAEGGQAEIHGRVCQGSDLELSVVYTAGSAAHTFFSGVPNSLLGAVPSHEDQIQQEVPPIEPVKRVILINKRLTLITSNVNPNFRNYNASIFFSCANKRRCDVLLLPDIFAFV